jgi:hypothetical protein
MINPSIMISRKAYDQQAGHVHHPGKGAHDQSMNHDVEYDQRTSCLQFPGKGAHGQSFNHDV